MADELVGTTLLGKLRVLRRVGEGAFGEVFEVEHTLTGHRRALKILRRDRSTDLEAVTRFVREARVTSRLESPHVAEVHDAGRLPDGRAYAVMDWLSGRPLRAVLEAEGRLSPARAARLVQQAAKGLAVVHAAGLLHRDLKPENLFVEDGDDGELLRILDFGLVSDDAAVTDALTREGAILGSPAYMSARRLDGEPAEPRDDVYALGVILYELLSGRRPFEGATLAALVASTHRGSIPSLADLDVDRSEGLQRVVDRALGRDQSSDGPLETADALDLALAELESSRDGDRVDGYTIVRSISRGGMGEIYEVRRTSDDERLAMKILRKDRLQDDKAAARMRKEAKLAARVAGEHAVPVVDAGTDPVTGAPYLVMHLLEGEDLGAVLRRGPLEPGRALELLRAVARALDAVHAAGLVHRDVKPENLFLLARDAASPEGSAGQSIVRILDFGIAALAFGDPNGGGTTTSAAIVGTPLYLAPEQIERVHPIGPATDRFALAQVTYSLLVGAPYFQTEASRGLLAVVSALSQDRLEAPSARARRRDRELPPGFDAWFARATAAEPASRFPSCREQVDALAAALAPARPRRSSRAIVAVALAIVAVGAASWAGSRDAPAEPRTPAVAEAPSTFRNAPSPATASPGGEVAVVPSPPTPTTSTPPAPATVPSAFLPRAPPPRAQPAPDDGHETLF